MTTAKTARPAPAFAAPAPASTIAAPPASTGARRQAGFTFPEVMLAMVVAVPLIMAVLSTTRLVNATIDADTRSATVHSLLRQTVQRIGQMVRPGKLSSFRTLSTMEDVNLMRATAVGEWIHPTDLVYRSACRFEAASGLLSMNAALSTSPRELVFQLEAGELDNGLDDDGDGLVDEGAISLLYDGANVLLVEGFTEFEVALDGRYLRLRLRCERVDDHGNVYGASMEQAFYVRNN